MLGTPSGTQRTQLSRLLCWVAQAPWMVRCQGSLARSATRSATYLGLGSGWWRRQRLGRRATRRAGCVCVPGATSNCAHIDLAVALQVDSTFRVTHTDPWVRGDAYRTSRTTSLQNTKTSAAAIHGRAQDEVEAAAGGAAGEGVPGCGVGSERGHASGACGCSHAACCSSGAQGFDSRACCSSPVAMASLSPASLAASSMLTSTAR